MTTSKHTTKRPAEGLHDAPHWLHTTPEQATALFEQEQDGGTLTPAEKAICNLHYGIQTAIDIESAVCYAGQDVEIEGEHNRLWKLGHSLTSADTIGEQAMGYGLLLTAMVESGALEAAIARLRKDLNRPLDAHTTIAVLETLAKEVPNG